MIIFNTIKKAEHYVKFCSKEDYDNPGYDWSVQKTYIEGNLVKVRNSGDSCGCGCADYLYNSVKIIGRIKSYNTKSIRDNKLKQLGVGLF